MNYLDKRKAFLMKAFETTAPSLKCLITEDERGVTNYTVTGFIEGEDSPQAERSGIIFGSEGNELALKSFKIKVIQLRNKMANELTEITQVMEVENAL